MATATVQVAEVGGYAGPARCYKIDPPFEGHEYVTVVAVPGYGGLVRPKAEVFPAKDSGACAEFSLMSRPGSFTLHDEPATTDKIEGAFWWALMSLGGYVIEVQDA